MNAYKRTDLFRRGRLARILACLFILVAAGIAWSDDALSQQSKKKALEEKKKKLQKEIEEKNKLLAEIKGSKTKSLLQLAILNNKIKDQEELISTLNGEINYLVGQINDTRADIRSKEEQLQKLKDDYAAMVRQAYKSRSSYDRLIFIFSAADFNQAYQRLKYFQQYAAYRKLQAGQIEGKKKELNSKLQELESKKSEQNSLLNHKENEKSSLSKEKEEKVQVLSDLQKKEKDIKGEVAKKKKQAEKISQMIKKIIEDEIKKSQPKDPKPKDPKKKKYDPVITLTPEEQIVSKNFEGNLGKLPWPVSEGVIIEKFGTHEHPDLPGIEINNNGIDIATKKGSEVRAIFEGEVKAVAEVGGMEGKIIIIRHGEYLSVYYTLSEVYVKTGDKVKTKQAIGKVMTDDDNKTQIHLEIYKGKNLLNPEGWIAKGS
ncbi:MAG: peptidoglycan DD-metalloendopeptidase family protein [Bacteroidota bacterium]